MATDTADLMDKVHDLLSSAYATASSDRAFLAFESMGVGISDAMFKMPPNSAYCAPFAVEHLSQIANTVPMLHGGLISRGPHTVEAVFETILQSSTPISVDAMQSVGNAKNEAAKAFDQVLGSVEGIPGYAFRPVFATPSNWFDPTAHENWTAHAEGQQQEVVVPPAPPRIVPMPPPVWRVLPTPVRGSVGRPIGPPPIVIRPSAMAVSAVRDTAAVADAAPALPAVRSIRPAEVTQATTALVASATAQAVGAGKVSVSFEHCTVMLTRRWLPDGLMLLRNWYLPGYAQGDISGGLGARDTGLMPVLTTAFVAVRNLRISAQWSDADLAVVEGAAAFGPFSLMGRTYDATSGTLSCPGMQIIGWFCSALPVLPPLSDPAPPKTQSTAPTPSSSVPIATAPAGAVVS